MKGISVIICCYNSERVIDRCLKHIFNQKVSSDFAWEIIVVNNNSSDSTLPFAYEAEKKYNVRKVKFTVVDELQPGLIHARKKGRDTSSYEYLLFTDDDNFLNENYVETAYGIMEGNQQIGIAGGFGIAEFENKNKTLEWFENHKLSYAVGAQANNSSVAKETNIVYGAGIVIRKSVWLKIEQLGFKNLLFGRKGKKLFAGEDTELCFAFRLAGYKVYYDPSLIFHHLIADKRTTKDYLQGIYFGFGKSNLVLGIYEQLLNSDVNPRTNSKFPLWINRLFYLRKVLSKHKKEHKNPEPFSNEWSKQIELQGQIKAIWELRNHYDMYFEKILSFKKAVKNIEKTY